MSDNGRETEKNGSMIAAFKEMAPAVSKRSPAVKLRILIVDDEEPIRSFVDRVLRDAGHETVQASSGNEALRTAASGTFDVVVTDVMMPQMNGDELARRLRQNDPGLKILYLTGFADLLFKGKLTLWEGEAFLDKPCSVKGLQQAVSLLAGGRVHHSDPPN